MTDQPTSQPTRPEQKRPSMNDRVEQVEQSLADARDQLGLLFKFKDDHRQGLQRLSSQHGTTSRRVDDLTQVSATHGKQLARLNEALEQLKARGEILGEHMTDAQATAINEELTRLNGQAKAFSAELQMQIDTLKQRVAELQEQVDMHGQAIARTEDRLDNVETAPMLGIDPATTAIELDGSVKSKTPWVKGIVAGVLAGLLVFVIYTPTVDNWDTAIQVAFSILAGLGVMLVVASVETFNLSLNGRLLWGRHERQREVDTGPVVIPAVMPGDAHQAPTGSAADEPTRQLQEVKP